MSASPSRPRSTSAQQCKSVPDPAISRRTFLFAASATSVASLAGCRADARRPNIILIMTDDQGWGDLSAGGNTILSTPNSDRVAAEGMRFEKFHVCPVCAPTRASLMTGRYNYRTGVVDTFKGRAMMHSDETTVAELLREGGYRTGIFGKWHLGDNFPLRATDQGFETALIHAGGGIGQPADPPENHYMDPMLMENGVWKQFHGYCTDIFTDAAIRFMEDHKAEPFFCYLATNTPHTPLEVPDEWAAPFRKDGVSPDVAKLYAMVKNIDDNVGRIFSKVKSLGIDNETIIVFLTDNGAGGPDRFNSGMRDKKTSPYEGGIRVPLFVRWPGRIAPGSVCERLAAHIDLMPTICEYANVSLPRSLRIDGKSLVPLLEGRPGGWADRTLFTQWHRGDAPIARESAAVLTERYKLVLKHNLSGGCELFDLIHDPGETTDLSSALPHIANDLTRRYDQWFTAVSATRGYAPPRIYIGAPEENPTTLTRQDWRGENAGWTENKGVQGYWEVDVRQPGAYRVLLRTKSSPLSRTAFFSLNGSRVSAPVDIGASSCEFAGVDIAAGPGKLEAWFESESPEGVKTTDGVWYVDIERIG